MQTTTFGFDTNYRIELAHDAAPFGVREFRKDRASFSPKIALETGAKFVLLKVKPDGAEEWIGRFRGGAEGLDGLFATPNPNAFCVVVKGQGYWVSAQEPSAFEVIRMVPVKQVFAVEDLSALIFVSYTRLSAYGPRGFMWITEDLSWDGLCILDVSEGKVRGTAWDSPADRDIPFSVDIATGKAEGGASPAKA